VDALRTFDELTATRRVVALAAADAHANLGLATASVNTADRARLALPRYEDVFRSFSIALPALRLTGDAASDARAVVGEIRAGRVYSSIDAFAAPARLAFTATNGAGTAGPGDQLPDRGPVTIRANSTAPAGARMTLLAQGRVISSVEGPTLTYDAPAGKAAYRVEVHLPGASPDDSAMPWVLSNPIYIGDSRASPPAPPGKPRAISIQYADGPMPRERWTIEKNEQSLAELDAVKGVTHGSRLLFRFGLAGSTATGAWIALGFSSGPDMPSYDRLMFSARADKPMRLWVQLSRQVPSGNQHWRRSVYLDSDEREIVVPFLDMRAVGDAPPVVPLDTVKAFQFVIDQTNTPLGASGRVWFDDIRYAR
jgi:hypothetical protein